MFGRNKKIRKTIEEESNLIINEIIKNASEIDTILIQKNLRLDKLSSKIDKLEEEIIKISETTQVEADFMKMLSETFASATPLSTIAEAEERMQILSDKIDKLESEKRVLAGKIGGLTSGNNKLKKKNKALAIDKRTLLKELKTHEIKTKNKLDLSRENKGYTSKKLPPVKPIPQKTRLKNRVKNYQAKNILKEITEEKEQTQDV